MDPNLRNLKDFLSLYNKVTEICFSRCVDSLHERDLTNSESKCVDQCVIKFARFNQKMMSVYVEVQTQINQQRMIELEEGQKKLQQASLEGTTTPPTPPPPAATPVRAAAAATTKADWS